MTTTTRRAMLSAGAATAAVAAIPMPASSASESKIPALFREWHYLMIELDPYDDEETELVVDRANAIADAIFAEPTVGAVDLAMKVVVADGGSFEVGSVWGEILAPEIASLAGTPLPQGWPAT